MAVAGAAAGVRLQAGVRDWLLAPGRRQLTLAAHALWTRARARVSRRAALAAEAGDLAAVLSAMGALEPSGRAAPLAAGACVADHMLTPEGRAALLPAAMAARARHPDSAYLIHLVTLIRAMGGEHRAAAADLAALLARPQGSGETGRRRFAILRDSWRMVDAAAREAMDWSEAPDIPAAAGEDGFREHLLQTRRREDYLAACDAALAAAATPGARLAALAEMLRPSLRHVASYTASHDLARMRFDALAEAWTMVLAGPVAPAATETRVRDLCALMALARRLGRDATADAARARLLALGGDGALAAVLWPVPAALAEDPGGPPEEAARVMAALQARAAPLTGGEVKAFFRWAELAGDHAGADAVLAALPDRLKRTAGLLPYAQMLQARGDFAGAATLLAEIHAQMMAHPLRLSAFFSRSLIKRRGELAFLIRTAAILGAVPQPRNPRGVMLVLARNVDQLRRQPLMALAEMKRRGWAVVPVVAGLLPPAPTGHAGIDILYGAITPQARLTSAADAALPPLQGFLADPPTRRLRWGDIDLDHCLWEEAAISRRRHTIDWTCPELAASLGRLCAWTGALARVLDHARALSAAPGGPRVGVISLFSARLPDALCHAHSRNHGDRRRYFSLLAANGYQNYFENFATNLSTRMVLRNMTAAPGARSASFPLPENFARFAATGMDRAPALLARHRDLARVTRSTGGAPPSPQAQAALDRIRTWRAAGGRVVCAFGRVLSDSAVPVDGGPAHADLRDWICHSVAAVAGSRTLLVVKPHPHEVNDLIATFPTEHFTDLLPAPLPDNVLVLDHRWCDIADLDGLIDLGLIYSGTTAVELGLLGIPCVLAGQFAPSDYPIGHAVPRDRAHHAALVRGEVPPEVAPDLAHRAALWVEYMGLPDFTLPYRYHARPITNRVIYPPWWFEEDLAAAGAGDPAIALMVDRALEGAPEPGGEG